MFVRRGRVGAPLVEGLTLGIEQTNTAAGHANGHVPQADPPGFELSPRPPAVPDAALRAARELQRDIAPISDQRASADYRRLAAAVVVDRLLEGILDD